MKTVQKFQGILNGVEYTDPKEFQEALKNVKDFSNYQMSQRFYTETVEDKVEKDDKKRVSDKTLQEELDETFREYFVVDVDKELKHIVDDMLTNEELVQEVIDFKATLKHVKYNFEDFYKQLDTTEKSIIREKISEINKSTDEEISKLEDEEYKLSRQLDEIIEEIYNRLDSNREKLDDIFNNRYVAPRHNKHTTFSDDISEYEDMYREYAKVKIKLGLLQSVSIYYYSLVE